MVNVREIIIVNDKILLEEFYVGSNFVWLLVVGVWMYGGEIDFGD